MFCFQYLVLLPVFGVFSTFTFTVYISNFASQFHQHRTLIFLDLPLLLGLIWCSEVLLKKVTGNVENKTFDEPVKRNSCYKSELLVYNLL
ncbi:hypothetical protein CEXT_460861 [Caerostris extrusa]|uniref:Uncharacterized protein n=1 Tax=Caerostris extrusa TaxID=172846 RepID=A0AAV4MW26_CAEEX|nr:hypothetical protein CEXT_460861 [Caerostris extrusa]